MPRQDLWSQSISSEAPPNGNWMCFDEQLGTHDRAFRLHVQFEANDCSQSRETDTTFYQVVQMKPILAVDGAKGVIPEDGVRISFYGL